MKGPESDSLYLLWGSIAISPLGYAYLAVRFLISFVVTTLFVIYDLVSTIFEIIWTIIRDIWPFLIIVAVIFFVLFIIHIYWPEFVDFLNNVFLPILQIIIDDFLRFLWNDLFIPVWNILVQLWNSLVQLIGFFIYFALNMFVMIMQIVVDLLGKLDLPAIFADVMEILTPMIKLATEMLKMLITVGTAIINKMIPIIMALMKIWFEYLKFIFKIVSWLIVTLFRALQPILKLVVAVVSVVAKMFRVRGAAGFASRSLLSMEKTTTRTGGKTGKMYDPFGLKGSSKTEDMGMFVVNELYSSASEHYTNQQYGAMLTALEYIHRGIRAEDAFHSTAGYYADPGQRNPDYTHHIYTEKDLEDHELRPGLHTGAGSRNPGGRPANHEEIEMYEEEFEREEETEELMEEEGLTDADYEEEDYFGLDKNLKKRDLKSWGGIDVSKLSPEEADKLELTQLEFIESIMGDIVDEREEMPDDERASPKKRPKTAKVPDQDFTTAKKRKPKQTVEELNGFKGGVHDQEDPYGMLNPEDHWRIDYSRKMKSEEVFSHLKGRKLKRPRLDLLHKPKTPKEMHEQRKRAVAYTHAIQTAYVKVYKRHIHSGHLHEVAWKTLKHLTGHDDVHNWWTSFDKKYASIGHFMYETIPSTHDKGFFKWLWKADPDYETRPPFHKWVENQYGNMSIPREHWEQMEAYEKAKEEGLTHEAHNVEDAMGPSHSNKRQLMADFFGGLKINLEILYRDDCFTTPRRNILCLPYIPTNWLIPPVNITGLVLTKDLNDNPMCEPVWKSTDCILCWEGVWNAIQEFRFLLYFLDLLSVIFIFGIFTPKPTEYIGYLSKLFPPLTPIVDMILIYDVGVFPNGTAWGCFFINLFYLYEGFIALLIIYYIIDPLWKWAQRTYRSYYTLVIAFRLKIAARREFIEQWDEALLASIDNSYHSVDRKRSRIKHAGYGARIQSELIGADIETAGVPQAIETPLAASDSGQRRFDRYRMSGASREQILALTALEMENEERRAKIAEKLDSLVDKMGAHITQEDEEDPRHHNRGRVIWNRVTSVIQMPFQVTPAFNNHLRVYQDHMRDHAAPPGANRFPSPHETFVHQSPEASRFYK